jgi:SAM-dependent methyltransferase
MRAIERVTDDKSCWKRIRYLPARSRIRPLYGAVDFRVVRRRPCAKSGILLTYHVLEIAAGTGVVTCASAPKLFLGASYVVTDLNQPMVDYAASRQPPDTRIKLRQADALALPFENAAISFVASSARCSFPTAHLVTAKQSES